MENLTHTSTLTVTPEHTAQALGSGDLPVLATPALIALMEHAAKETIRDLLQAGQSSVGTQISIEHTRATGLGIEVRATARLTAQEGRRYDFELHAEDEEGNDIGNGTHTRFAIDVEKFMGKIKNNR